MFEKLQRLAQEFSRELPTPGFYTIFAKEIERSRDMLSSNHLVKQCVNHLEIGQEEMGHGFAHSRAVAVDAGALSIIESSKAGYDTSVVEQLVRAAHIAGLLHDIKRGEEDHAYRGSRVAEQLIDCFGLSENFKRYVVVAIRNHEAFKKQVPTEDEYGRLLSDALYDADKFRWGVDNFTEMLWDMLRSGNIEKDELLNGYHRGLEYIEKIKETFRTETGKRYGPEIIETGLTLGRRLYPYIKDELG